jgi:hypothetical protein
LSRPSAVMAKKRISRYIERRRIRRRIDFDDSLINKRIGLHRSFCSIQATISRMTLEENKYQSLIIKKVPVKRSFCM